MSIQRSLVAVSNTSYTAASAPSVLLRGRAKRWIVENQDATNTVTVSFDGVNDHATLVPGKPSAMLEFMQFTDRLWLKTAAGTPSCQVICEF